MSGLGRVPSFEPDEEAKAMIESMFAQKKEVQEETTSQEEISAKKFSEDEKPVSNITPGKRHRVKIPEPPEQTKKQQEAATDLAKEELEVLHEAFMEFSEKTSDTVVYGYLYSEILKLVEAFQDMDDMVNDTIDKEKITENGMEWYEKMRKIRARVLNDVYNKYKSEK